MFWPKKIKWSQIWAFSLSSFVSWLIGSIFLFIFIFFLWWILSGDNSTNTSSSIFPLALSFVWFITSIFSSILNYLFMTKIDEKYKKTVLHFWHIWFLGVLLYIFLAPLYVWIWIKNINNVMYIFILHMILSSFWQILLAELLNNYRYVFVWFYGSFVWMLFSFIISLFLFSIFPFWYAKLIALVVIFPISYFLNTFFKTIFEMIYYKYFEITWNDQLGDVFRQIEIEEQEQLKESTDESLI